MSIFDVLVGEMRNTKIFQNFYRGIPIKPYEIIEEKSRAKLNFREDQNYGYIVSNTGNITSHLLKSSCITDIEVAYSARLVYMVHSEKREEVLEEILSRLLDSELKLEILDFISNPYLAYATETNIENIPDLSKKSIGIINLRLYQTGVYTKCFSCL